MKTADQMQQRSINYILYFADFQFLHFLCGNYFKATLLWRHIHKHYAIHFLAIYGNTTISTTIYCDIRRPYPIGLGDAGNLPTLSISTR